MIKNQFIALGSLLMALCVAVLAMALLFPAEKINWLPVYIVLALALLCLGIGLVVRRK